MNYREELIKDILPFWLDNAIDTENGGIFTCLDERVIFTERKKAFGFRAAHCGASQGRTLLSKGTQDILRPQDASMASSENAAIRTAACSLPLPRRA